jgi:hypothetical protein
MLQPDRCASTRGSSSARFTAVVLALGWAGLALAQTADLPNRKDPLQGITSAGQPNAEQLSAAAAVCTLSPRE